MTRNPEPTAPYETDVLLMVRRLADRLDLAVDPRGDNHAVVSEALIRLALAVYVNTQGAAETRERLMGFALTLSTPTKIHWPAVADKAGLASRSVGLTRR